MCAVQTGDISKPQPQAHRSPWQKASGMSRHMNVCVGARRQGEMGRRHADGHTQQRGQLLRALEQRTRPCKMEPAWQHQVGQDRSSDGGSGRVGREQGLQRADPGVRWRWTPTGKAKREEGLRVGLAKFPGPR